tara:strand:- start:1784 stop:2287 length:504 start_codon:yes stop_codon:yes gene_type:complete
MEFDEKLMKIIWSHIDKTDTCWLSKYAKNKYGYTSINYLKKLIRFHRLMLFWNDQTKITEFADWKNWLACHTCPNKHCVNPNHLYWGTQKDNMRDRINDGNVIRGENVKASKLTEAQVLEIREKYAKKKNKYDREISASKLAKEYGVSVMSINNVISRKLWSHLSNS